MDRDVYEELAKDTWLQGTKGGGEEGASPSRRWAPAYCTAGEHTADCNVVTPAVNLKSDLHWGNTSWAGEETSKSDLGLLLNSDMTLLSNIRQTIRNPTGYPKSDIRLTIRYPTYYPISELCMPNPKPQNPTYYPISEADTANHYPAQH